MGMFDVEKGQFDPQAISQADIDNDLLPALVMGEAAIGETAGGVEVWAAIGDNQASFLGATGRRSNLLANVGTSSQLSVRSKRMVQATGLDTRPYVQGEYLLVGAGLCGGSAYALLRDLFADVLNLYEINAEKDALYQKMNAAAKHTIESKNPLVVDIRFRGTRMTPGVRGAITQIGTENFTIGQLALGVMRGICEELYGFYALVPKGICGDDETMVGSGNALRKNEVLRGVLARRFGKILQLSPYEEDGALGISRFVSSQ